MSPPNDRGRPRQETASDVEHTSTTSIAASSDVPAQIRRRRVAADRLPPLEDSQRDPLHGVRHSRGRLNYDRSTINRHGKAQCVACGERRQGNQALAWAARHAADVGHLVLADYSAAYYYAPARAAS